MRLYSPNTQNTCTPKYTSNGQIDFSESFLLDMPLEEVSNNKLKKQ